MNILIVGNGFDLSHYLPTKYDHFMDVMRAIEEKDTGGLPEKLVVTKLVECLEQIDKTFEKRQGFEPPAYHMCFDELFVKTRDPKFITKTKEFYLTNQLLVTAQDILKMQYRLKLNCWYHFFKSHVAEIQTWIDFEQKIEEVLLALARCLIDLKSYDNSEINNYLNSLNNQSKCIRKSDLDILNFFNFTIYKKDLFPYSFNKKFCHGEKIENGFSPSRFLDFLYSQLDDFIAIFNLYLNFIVSQLSPASIFEMDVKEWEYPDKIFSFNYTNTFQRIYDSVDVEYLHGSHGDDQNIVLGVSDLEDESLKKLKAFGFTKYHQKLFKDTDYLFLDEYKNKIKLDSRKINKLEIDNFYAPPDIDEQRTECIEKAKLHIKFSIWGHSLDISDKDYVIDLFSLNDDMDRNVRVTIFYFDKPAKFSLLNNLLAILGKDKVEQWMKNEWLVFKPNPEIKFEQQSNLDEAS